MEHDDSCGSVQCRPALVVAWRRGMIGPCMCGDPECGRCFPGSYRMARLYNSSEFQRRVDREIARIKAAPRETLDAIVDYADEERLASITAQEYSVGTLPLNIERLVDDCVRQAAELRVEEDMG